MARAVGLSLLLILTSVLLTLPPAIAQIPAVQSLVRHEDPACGFSVVVPDKWEAFRRPNDHKAQMQNSKDTSKTRPTVVWVGPIWDTKAAAGTPEALVLASAAAWCLDCLGSDLEWLDRYTFAAGSVSVVYTISKNVSLDYADGRRLTNGIGMDFFIVENGTARGLGDDGWTRALLEAWVPAEDFGEMEPLIHAIVRTVRFFNRDPAQDCKF